jgi:hypothetical protein
MTGGSMPFHLFDARPGARRPRRIALSSVLVCAALLVSVSPAASASADARDGGPQGTVTRPVPPAAARPTFSIPGRSATAAPKVRRPSAAEGAKGLKALALSAAQRTDFDGDGFGDLAYRANYGAVWTDWGYGASEAISPDDAQVKDLLLPGDLTGDGKADLLTLTATGELRLHDGAQATVTGALGPYTRLSTGWQAYNKLFVPGDLTGDGAPDLLARSTAGLFLFPGTGTGFAATGISVGGAGWSQFDQLVGVDDVNGDGLADIVARNSTGLYVYPGNGSSTGYPFQDRFEVPGGSDWQKYNQIIGGSDYDGDGTADLMGRTAEGALTLYRGAGDGTFLPAVAVGTDWGTVTQFAGAGNQPNFGKSGVFARTADGTLYYYETTGTGRLQEKYLIGTGWDRADSSLTHAVSLRGSGVSDLIQHSTYDGHLYNTAGYAAGDQDLAGGSKLYNLVVGPGDLDGDGKSDLLARSSTDLFFYGGNGDGLSVKGRVSVGGSGWSQFNKIVGAGDLTGDGRADIVARTPDGLFLYAGTGKAATPFGAKAQVGGAGWSQYATLAAPGDMNGDGVADLLASNSAGELYYYAGTGKAATPFKERVQIGSGGWNQYPDLL